MSLNKKAIETISVGAVKTSIEVVGFLEQCINENDKELSWDGTINIYSNKSRKKDTFLGQIPVQVKGKVCNEHSRREITYSMSMADLKNYLIQAGTLLFVVYMDDNGEKTKIYYSLLTPIKLRGYIEKSKEQKSKSIKLVEFPLDNNKKLSLLSNFFLNCQKQSSFTDAKLLSLEELKKLGVLEGITIPVSSAGQSDVQMVLITNEVYVYAKVKGSPIPQPVEMLEGKCFTTEERDADITISGKQFYSKYYLIKSEEGISLRIGDSFTMSFPDSDRICTINYVNSKKIRLMAKDLDFMISFLENGAFKLNNIVVPYDKNSVDESSFNIKEQKNKLAYINKVIQVFDILGYKGDLDISTMDNDDWRNIDRLITAFIEKKPVSGLNDELPPVLKLKIGKLIFMLALEKCKNCKNTYNINDFFALEAEMVYENEAGEIVPISQYAILDKDDIISLSNINYNVLLPSFKKVKRHSETMSRANFFMLELISAYDSTNGKNKHILRTAHDFIDWIMELGKGDIDRKIIQLNLLQIIKREREFTTDEIRELFMLTDENKNKEEYIVGAYLLLDKQAEAEKYFAKLSKEQQDTFRNYPIYFFWNEEKINGQV